jgi:Secretion system C-terminal sorting domain
MKNLILLIFTICSFNTFAQYGNRIKFSYDSAGNQFQRALCLNCATTRTAPPKEFKKLEPEDLKKFNSEDLISYYPNPVQQELYLKWELVNDNKVTAIQVFSVTGILLKTFPSLESANDQIINFQEYPTGNYFLEMMYTNGEQKSIQIIKK